MATILDCVLLSEDVYEDSLASRVAGRGWTRIHTYMCGGFYACHYSKNGESIIAYRGTNDLADIVADANQMVVLNAAPVGHVQAYGITAIFPAHPRKHCPYPFGIRRVHVITVGRLGEFKT